MPTAAASHVVTASVFLCRRATTWTGFGLARLKHVPSDGHEAPKEDDGQPNDDDGQTNVSHDCPNQQQKSKTQEPPKVRPSRCRCESGLTSPALHGWLEEAES